MKRQTIDEIDREIGDAAMYQSIQCRLNIRYTMSTMKQGQFTVIKGLNAYVNLIPYNMVDEHGFRAVDLASALKFYDKLMKLGVKCTLRKENGGDIDAACGQLRAKAEGRL